MTYRTLNYCSTLVYFLWNRIYRSFDSSSYCSHSLRLNINLHWVRLLIYEIRGLWMLCQARSKRNEANHFLNQDIAKYFNRFGKNVKIYADLIIWMYSYQLSFSFDELYFLMMIYAIESICGHPLFIFIST